MTTTLTLDESGQINLPEALKRIFGARPGESVRAEVTEGRIEIVKEVKDRAEIDDLPIVSEMTSDGVLVIPRGARAPTADGIVAAIKADRDERIAKLSKR